MIQESISLQSMSQQYKVSAVHLRIKKRNKPYMSTGRAENAAVKESTSWTWQALAACSPKLCCTHLPQVWLRHPFWCRDLLKTRSQNGSSYDRATETTDLQNIRKSDSKKQDAVNTNEIAKKTAMMCTPDPGIFQETTALIEAADKQKGNN